MKLYGFRPNGLVPTRVDGRFIHELDGTKQKSRYRVEGNSQILNYRVVANFDDNVYESFEEAKTAAEQRLIDHIQRLEEELCGCKQDLLDLGKEKP